MTTMPIVAHYTSTLMAHLPSPGSKTTDAALKHKLQQYRLAFHRMSAQPVQILSMLKLVHLLLDKWWVTLSLGYSVVHCFV